MLKFAQKHRLICHIFGLSCVGIDADQQVYILLSIFGEKDYKIFVFKYDFYLGSKIELNYRQSYMDCGPEAIYFLSLSSFQLI